MEIVERVQILIVAETEFGSFRDAWSLTHEEREKLDDEAIRKDCAARVERHVSFLQARRDNPPIEPEPSRADLEKELVRIEMERMKIENKIQAKIEAERVLTEAYAVKLRG